jgi:3-oxoadipate enol-lactonase
MAMLAADVLAGADAAGFARFSVAGVSLGGIIAMELAVAAPERIEKLIPICTSATMDSASWNDRIAKVRGEGMAAIADLAMGRFLSDTAEPAIYEAVRRQLLGMDAQGYAGCGAAIRDMYLAERISGIAAPTLVVTGTRDTSTPFEGHGEYLLARIPGAAHLSIEAAHLAPLEAPAELASGMIAFLQD